VGRKPRTLLEVCVLRAGGGWRDVAKGSRVALFIAEWSIAAAAQDQPLSALGFMRYWKCDAAGERRAWRHLAEFKSLFPEYDNPQPIADRFKDAAARTEAVTVMTWPLDGVAA
jgi:hypothetical protein